MELLMFLLGLYFAQTIYAWFILQDKLMADNPKGIFEFIVWLIPLYKPLHNLIKNIEEKTQNNE